MDLSQLTKGSTAQVLGVQSLDPDDAIAQRLLDLGFVAGELVKCISLAPFGGDPLLVQIGYTRFALRKVEAARVQVEDVA
ncbi:MAG: ferrous iron transport protein A [Arenimonas sp.]|nr:ferrous iron transport protein A [Arenimonas sp.]